MPYISEFLNNKVTDSSDSVVGKLQDILIQPINGSFAPLEFLLVVKNKTNEKVLVPFSLVENFTKKNITLKTLFNKAIVSQAPGQNYIYLINDVLDKQIVDVGGTRVVRVNDLRLGTMEDRMCVVGIDPSFKGLLRRIGLDQVFFADLFKVQLIDWRKTELLQSGPLQLNTASDNLSRLHPADLANILEELDVKQGSRILSRMEAVEAAKVLEEVDPELQNVLVKYLGPEAGGKIVSQMSSDEAADLVKAMDEEDAKIFLSKLEKIKAGGIAKLINYPSNTAGGLMSLDFVSVRPGWNVAKAVEEIRKLSPGFRSIVFVYVTEEDGTFHGVVSLRRLLIADPKSLMDGLLKKISKISTLEPGFNIRKVIRIMTKYNLYTAAVLDKEKKLVGVVTIDDVMRHLFPEA